MVADEERVIKKVTNKLDWKDIRHENYRTYIFIKDYLEHSITILNPVLLNVSKSGGHRIVDADNMSHYIPSGWIHLFWTTNDDNAYLF